MIRIALVLAVAFASPAIAQDEPEVGQLTAFYTVDGVKVKEWIPRSRPDLFCIHTTSIMGANLACFALPKPPSRRAETR